MKGYTKTYSNSHIKLRKILFLVWKESVSVCVCVCKASFFQYSISEIENGFKPATNIFPSNKGL